MQTLLARVVHTLDPTHARADAITLDGGRVVAVGARDDLVRAHPSAALVDLGERVICPGFIDAHHHLSLRCALSTGVDCTPAAAPSIDALSARLRESATRAPPGAWILAWGYDELGLAERRHPTRHDLDSACPDHPVFLFHYSCHEAIASSRALALAHIDRATPDPPAGEIVRDRRGEPTGRLVETAYAPVERLAFPDRLARGADDVLARLIDAQLGLFRVGITHVADPTVQSEMAALYARARAQGSLRVGVTAMPLSDRGMLLTPWDRLGRGPHTGDGDETLSTGSLKMFFDGGTRCSMCATSAEIVNLSLRGMLAAARTRRVDFLRTLLDAGPRRGHGGWRSGVAYVEGDDAAQIVSASVADGFSVAIHAIGNAAIDEALAALRSSRARHASSTRRFSGAISRAASPTRASASSRSPRSCASPRSISWTSLVRSACSRSAACSTPACASRAARTRR